MDKSTYLKRLEMALREKYAEPQVRDILSDYEDFFASGAEAGKSEAELCAEFGPPEQAAGELKSESEAETPRGLMQFTIACSVLAIAFIAVFWIFREVFLAPHIQLPNAVSFGLALLFPLSLEGVLAVWFSRNISPRGGMKWIPAVQAVLAVPVIAALVWLIYYAQSIPSFLYTDLQQAGTLVARVTGTLTNAVYLILCTTIALFLLYTTHGHRRAHWFLFLDTTLLTLILNFISLLSQINPETYDSAEGIARCFLWAVLPNLAAAGIVWAIRKIVSVRRAKAWTGR